MMVDSGGKRLPNRGSAAKSRNGVFCPMEMKFFNKSNRYKTEQAGLKTGLPLLANADGQHEQ